MNILKGSDRIQFDALTTPDLGVVKWKAPKSFWLGSMTAATLILGPLTFSWSAISVFIVLSVITLCAGHSVGMHRRLIHNSFKCPLWLEYLMVYLGVLVGMAGPIGMMRQHDLRDWAQRQHDCHDYLCHRRGILLDYFWQCDCDVELENAPQFIPEQRVKEDRIYDWMERYWMLHQAPLAFILFLLGGWSFVIWGIAVRVTVSVTGHWLVGYFAHHEFRDSKNKQSWEVTDASVQGKDVSIAGLISMGESWHNNHHAFPESAKIGLFPGQPDPGWQFIKVLQHFGLVWDIKTPENLPARASLKSVAPGETAWSICLLRKRIWRQLFSK